MTWFIPLLATIISFGLFYLLLKQYVSKRKIHHLLYSISLFLFTLATFIEFFADVYGLNTTIYKIYYFSAITLVAIMSSGTAYLISKDRKWFSHLFLLYVTVLSLWLLYLIIPADLVMDVTNKGIAIGGEGMPDYIRKFSFPLSGVGGILLIIGSLYSYMKTKYKGNLYIAAGAIVMASAGRLATIGLTSFLSLSELIGIALLYYGVTIHPESKK